MSTLGGSNPTLLDVAKLTDPDGSTPRVAEMLNQKHEFLDDAVWIEGNMNTGHRITQRVGLPDVYFRLINQGVPSSKSTEVQIDEDTAMLEAFSTIDTKLVEMAADPKGFRLIKEQPFLEALAQKMATTSIYGVNKTAPETFNGMAIRYSDNTNALSKENVIDGGGTGSDNRSIYLIGWGENTVSMIYPKGSKAGISQEDLGIETVYDENKNPFRAYRTHWRWEAGLALHDWRYAIRIANIDKSNLVGETSAADILKLMALGVDKLPSTSGIRPAFYVPRVVRSMLRIQCMNKPNVWLQAGNEEGKPKLSFDQIPIRLLDALDTDEAQVV